MKIDIDSIEPLLTVTLTGQDIIQDQQQLEKRLDRAIEELIQKRYRTFLCGLNTEFDLLAGHAILLAMKRHSEINMIAVRCCNETDAKVHQKIQCALQSLSNVVSLHVMIVNIDKEYLLSYRYFDFMTSSCSYILCYYEDKCAPILRYAAHFHYPIDNLY